MSQSYQKHFEKSTFIGIFAKINDMAFNFTPSEYQKKIFEFFEKSVGNVVINAKAGSSKTTTAIGALDYIPGDKKVLFLAFNKSIAAELKDRITDKPNVSAWTFHGLGYRIVLENLDKKPELDQYKYKNYITKNLDEISDGITILLEKDEKERYKNNCNELVDLARYNKCQSAVEIGEVAEKYGIVPVSNEIFSVEKILKWGQQSLETIDYTDMEWLPYELNMSTYKYKFDWIIIDEAQDTSPVRQELFKKCIKKSTRFAAIGDKDQTINTWCGSDEAAFDNFLKEKDTIKLDLPICYRCPKKVIELLQTLVPDIQAAPWAIEGEINRDVSLFKAEPGDMVLCRTSAPLTVAYSDLIKKNIKAYIKGNDIGNNLITLIKSTGVKSVSFDFEKDGIIPRLYKALMNTLIKIAETNNLSISDAIQTEKFMKLYDAIKTIEILGNGTTDLTYLKDRINTVFSDDGNDGVCLSTVHKAKGLEADNVFILCPSLMPSPLAQKDWEIEAEQNIQYVAWSRAKKTLNFVSEKLFPVERCYADSNSMLNDMYKINQKLIQLYSKDFLGGLPDFEKNKMPRITVPKKTVIDKYAHKKSKIGANKFKSFMK